MTPRHRATLVASAAVALLGLGGCGDKDADALAPVTGAAAATADGTLAAPAEVPAPTTTTSPSDVDPQASETTAPSSPSLRSYLRQGNKICLAGSAGLSAIGADVAGYAEPDLLIAIAERVVPNVRDQVAGLRALGYPAGDVRRLSGILGDTDAVLDAWVSDPTVAFTDTRMDTIKNRLYDYGLTSCGDS